jgi:hypothetical protein
VIRQGFRDDAFSMRFRVAREGAVVGEFEEQIFRNKIFSGENPARMIGRDF